jgi:hypothetical protein
MPPTIEEQYPHPSPNKIYTSEAAWFAFVNSTPVGSEEREFVDWVQSNYPNGYTFFTTAACNAFYNPDLHQLNGGYMTMRVNSQYAASYPESAWYFYHFVLK